MSLLTPLAGAEPAPPEPTGASLAWTSRDPAVVHARHLLEEGQFARAEAEMELSAANQPARAEMIEIIGRIRNEYPLSAEELVAKFQASLPGTTVADIERWRAAGEVNWRMIDGKPAYFRREPANLFRFCGEAKNRRTTKDEAPAGGWTLAAHLKQVIAEAERTGLAYVQPIKHRVTYSLTVPAGAPGMKAGATVRVWLPFPQEHRRQGEVKLISASPAGATIAPIEAAQRTVYFEQRVTDPAKPLVFSEVIEFTSTAYCPNLDNTKALPLPTDYAGGCLSERPPHIIFTPQLRKAVAEAVGNETDPLVRARGIFHWIGDHIAYHAELEYGVIPSFSTKALAVRRGDCGVQAMLFITMCRCAGIPARWQSGWETKPVGSDMHDWAEFYIRPQPDSPLYRQLSSQPSGSGLDRDGGAWLPCDVTYGQELKDNTDPKIRDFYCGHIDSYRLIVNRDYGAELFPPKKSLRSEPADFQRGEVEIDGRNLYFNVWTYEVNMERGVK